MRRIATASAALLAATLGSAAVTPAAFSQDQHPQSRDAGHELFLRHHGEARRFGPQLHIRRGGLGMHHVMKHRGGDLLALACSERGAEWLEHRLLSLSHRLDPTPEQQPLFKDFRTAALTAQTRFADRCAELRPQEDSAAAPDLVERLRRHIGVGEARTAAMNEVLPALEAFHGSLSDEQRALLDSHQGRRGGRHGMRSDLPPSPAAPQAPALDG